MFVRIVNTVEFVRNVGNVSLKGKREKRKNKQKGQHAIKGDVEEAVRVKRRQIGNHGGIGQKEGPSNVSNGKNGEERSHRLKAESSRGLIEPSVIGSLGY